MTEQELAARVVAWLQEQGWTVHEEVECGCVADIVAIMDRRIWVIECKRTFGLAVMSQADQWRRWVHWVSVATPATKAEGNSFFANSILSDRGIGRIIVGRKRHEFPQLAGKVEVVMSPTMMRRPDPYWLSKMRAALVPENTAGAQEGARAGSANGGYWTTWRDTCRQILWSVEKNPGVTLKALLDENKGYHYSTVASARHSLSVQLRNGAIPGIRIEQDGRHLRLYPDTDGLQ